MNTIQYNKLFAFLWNIATDVLVNKVDATEYKKIILPFIVLRRLDLLLEPSKQTVLDIVAEEGFSNLPPESQSEQLYAITGYPFYNTSAYTMKTLCLTFFPDFSTSATYKECYVNESNKSHSSGGTDVEFTGYNYTPTYQECVATFNEQKCNEIAETEYEY